MPTDVSWCNGGVRHAGYRWLDWWWWSCLIRMRDMLKCWFDGDWVMDKDLGFVDVLLGDDFWRESEGQFVSTWNWRWRQHSPWQSMRLCLCSTLHENINIQLSIYSSGTSFVTLIYSSLFCTLFWVVLYFNSSNESPSIWSRHIRAYIPRSAPSASNSSWLPRSTSFPLSRTRIMSALLAVLSRCAINSVVLPLQTAAAVCGVNMLRWISRSVPLSKADVASSRRISYDEMNQWVRSE